MATNLTLLNPIEQIKVQKLEAMIYTDERSYFETKLTLCEDDEISIDVRLEINLAFDPAWDQTEVTKVKVHFLSAYDSRECEDIELNPLEKIISENLIIKLNA
jgi:hypothetical protein